MISWSELHHRLERGVREVRGHGRRWRGAYRLDIGLSPNCPGRGMEMISCATDISWGSTMLVGRFTRVRDRPFGYVGCRQHE